MRRNSPKKNSEIKPPNRVTFLDEQQISNRSGNTITSRDVEIMKSYILDAFPSLTNNNMPQEVVVRIYRTLNEDARKREEEFKGICMKMTL